MNRRRPIHRLVPLVLMLLLLTFASCMEQPMGKRTLYAQRSSGVVLVRNNYYYSASVGGFTFYFTGLDSVGRPLRLTDSPASLRGHERRLWATGFFVSRDGYILTDRAVARPALTRAQLRRSSGQILAAAAQYFSSLSELALRSNDQEDYERYEVAAGVMSDADSTQLQVAVVSDLAVACKGSHSGDPSAFLKCEMARVSGLDDVDLAVLQLRSKRTPKRHYAFGFDVGAKGRRTLLETLFKRIGRDNASRRLVAGMRVYTLGYDTVRAGRPLPDVLKPAITSGELTAAPEDGRLRYNIPSTDGASGSPVINRFGEVVGLNIVRHAAGKTVVYGIDGDVIKQFLAIDDN